MEDYSDIIAKNLINLRKSQGYTQQEFARILNYSDKTISKWELGYATPNVETLKQIADFYNVKIDYFLEPHDELPDSKAPIMRKNTRRILLTVLVDLFFLATAAVIYAAQYTAFEGTNYWPIFIWGLGAVFFATAIFCNKWWRYTLLPYLFASLTIWTILVGIYLTLIWTNTKYNFWYLFFVGLPIQVAAIIIIKLTHSTHSDF